MANPLTKHLLLLFLMLLSFYFPVNSLSFSHAANITREKVLVIPIEAVDLGPEVIKSLTNSYLSKLKSNKRYKFLSGKKVTEAINKALFKNGEKGEKCEDDCLRSIAEKFGANLTLLTGINKENKGYSLVSKIIDISNGSVLVRANKECRNCRVVSLKKLIEDLAKGIGEEKRQKKKKLNKKSQMEEEFKKLEEMDLLSNSLFSPKKKIKAWKKYLSKYSKKNPRKKEAKKKITLLKIDLVFVKTDKSASKTEYLKEQEKLWKKFLSKYEKIGRHSTIKKAKRKMESIAEKIKEEERKKIRERRRRRQRRNN